MTTVSYCVRTLTLSAGALWSNGSPTGIYSVVCSALHHRVWTAVRSRQWADSWSWDRVNIHSLSVQPIQEAAFPYFRRNAALLLHGFTLHFEMHELKVAVNRSCHSWSCFRQQRRGWEGGLDLHGALSHCVNSDIKFLNSPPKKRSPRLSHK